MLWKAYPYNKKKWHEISDVTPLIASSLVLRIAPVLTDQSTKRFKPFWQWFHLAGLDDCMRYKFSNKKTGCAAARSMFLYNIMTFIVVLPHPSNQTHWNNAFLTSRWAPAYSTRTPGDTGTSVRQTTCS